MTHHLNESSGRISEHEPSPPIERVKCDQEAGELLDILIAKQALDLTDKTCQDCRRCI